MEVIDTQPGLFFDELQERGAHLHMGSVTDPDLVNKAIDGCEVVYHLAAMFRRVNAPKSAYLDVNVAGTRLLAQAAQSHGVRSFVNCSTQGVHGHIAQTPGDENSPIAPEDYYQYTKYEGERVLGEFAGQGMSVVTIRPTAIYGPGDPERFLMLFKRVRKGRFLMFGKGAVHYHPVYIDNLVDAFELAAESEDCGGETYLVGDDRYYTLNDLVRAIAKSLDVELTIQYLPFWPLWVSAVACEALYKPLPAEPPLFRRRIDWFRQNRAFSIDKARGQLGYQPKVGLDEGLARTATWYREEGYL